MSVGHCYLIEPLLEFFKMDNINELPKENDPFPPDECSEEEKKAHLLAVLDKFLEEHISLEIPACGKDFDGDCGDDDSGDGIFNCGVNLLSSFMLLLDCKHAVASGNGEHLALVQKQMLYHFSSVSGYNSYAIEMLITTIQNEVLLSTAEAHHCKWAALVNWKGGDKNKTEKAIQRMSKAAGGVSKIINVFEDQAMIKPKSSMHSHKSSTEDEKKISGDLKKLKPFSVMPGRFHASFTGISSNPLEDFNEVKFGEWLLRHQKNIAVHFPTADDADVEDADIDNGHD